MSKANRLLNLLFWNAYQIVWPEEILFLDIEEIEAEFEDFDFVEFQSCRLFDFVEINSSEILLNGRHCSDKLKKSYNQLRLSFILYFYLYIHDVHASMLLSKCLFFPFQDRKTNLISFDKEKMKLKNEFIIKLV